MEDTKYFAHTVQGESGTCRWQLLEDHLKRVAQKAGEFAEAFGAREWGYLAGLWHDLGKYSNDFQLYLKSQQEACSETQAGRVDHSTAGAQYAVQSINILGHLLAYAIAGHHTGLLDGRAEDACQEKRLKKETPDWRYGLRNLPGPARSACPPDYLRAALGKRDSFATAFFVRMLFSCLVDADFLDTEEFMEPEKRISRSSFPRLDDLAPRFFKALEEIDRKETEKPINKLRRSVRRDCERASEQPPGFFSLTVPTGGGKTLSSLDFAIRHALRHGLHRIIYVVPFTTIIEQNADVFRKYLGDDCVLEHHSSVDPEKETQAARLAAENWDAPLVVTTSVQFFESLFSNRPSRCRKLHRLAKSVIILDEAQTIPVDYLQPCLRALKELVNAYCSTIVLCTATQPAITKRADFDIGLDSVREIAHQPERLYQALKRVEISKIGKQSDGDMRDRILRERQVLCITNTVRHARKLFEAIGLAEGHFHLSARMCPAHRRRRLAQVKEALKNGSVCRLVSTQVVEAGVDIDFAVVYRALAGLDSIAQAAGRCNRNGDLPGMGQVYVFIPEDSAACRYFADTANCAAQVLELYADPLELKANEHFFRLYYWDQKDRWDNKGILDDFYLDAKRSDFPFIFLFEKAAEDFKMIEDGATCNVIIPWGEEGKYICDRLRSVPSPGRDLLRQAQPFMVQVFRHEWSKHAGRNIRLIYDDLGILESPETHYSEDVGLSLEAEGAGYYFA